MKFMWSIFFELIIFLVLLGCGKSREEARLKLGQMNIPFTERAFIDYLKKGDTYVVDLFLTTGINPNARDRDGKTALMLAAMGGRADFAKWLLEKGANPHVTWVNRTAFSFAIEEGQTTTVLAMLDAIGDVDAKIDTLGNTALMMAASAGNADIVQALIKKGADVNAENNYSTSVIMWGYSYPEIVQLLRKHGAKE